jgi:hypothetical protein
LSFNCFFFQFSPSLLGFFDTLSYAPLLDETFLKELNDINSHVMPDL